MFLEYILLIIIQTIIIMLSAVSVKASVAYERVYGTIHSQINRKSTPCDITSNQSESASRTHFCQLQCSDF